VTGGSPRANSNFRLRSAADAFYGKKAKDPVAYYGSGVYLWPVTMTAFYPVACITREPLVKTCRAGPSALVPPPSPVVTLEAGSLVVMVPVWCPRRFPVPPDRALSMILGRWCPEYGPFDPRS